MGYSLDELRAYGFGEFVPFPSWTRSQVLPNGESDVEGVYAIGLAAPADVRFVDDCHHKPRGSIWAAAQAEARWVPDAEVLYFGKAPLRPLRPGRRPQGLANRIAEYHAHGYRRGAQHYGGKLVWQLDRADHLLVGWKAVPIGQSAIVESGLIKGFALLHGRQPYANSGAPLRAAPPIFL